MRVLLLDGLPTATVVRSVVRLASFVHNSVEVAGRPFIYVQI